MKGIVDWPAPTTLRQLRSFLSFCNYYRKFIKKYSDKCCVLNELLQKKEPWRWTDKQHSAFETLKQEFTKEPVLRMPDQTCAFQIEANASKYASGAVLTQEDKFGERHPVAFLLKSFTATEWNYEIYDRELLSIIRALQEWRHYIQGSPFKTKVLSDHKNLTYFRNPQKLNRRQARASLELSEYDLELKHIPGDKMVLADALSRQPDLCPVEDHNNEKVVLLPEDLFVALIDVELQDAVAKLQQEDSIALEALRLLTETNPLTPSLDTKWTTEVDSTGSKVLFYKGKIYIPQDMELR